MPSLAQQATLINREGGARRAVTASVPVRHEYRFVLLKDRNGPATSARYEDLRHD